MKLRIISDKSKNTVSVFVERSADTVKENVWNELLCSEEFFDFDCNISLTPEELRITLSLRNGALISNCANQMSAEDALKCLSDFASFVFCEENNKEYILGANNIFFDGEKLRFVKAIAPIEQSRIATVKFFINSVITDNPNITSDIAQALINACESEEQMPDALIGEIERLSNPVSENTQEAESIDSQEAIPESEEIINEESVLPEPTTENISQMAKKLENEDDSGEPVAQEEQAAQTSKIMFCPSCGSEYSEELVFCIKCGEMLQPKEVPSETAGEPVNEENTTESVSGAQIISEAAESPAVSEPSGGMFGETTLLGFTNFGETSILGGGMNASYDMPNLIRASTDEKIFITKRNFLIGKSREKADYAVANNNAISRVHAEIIVSGNEYYIFDKGSTNHTYVNNVMVNQDSSVQIFDGDEIKLADEVFTFKLQ